MWLNMLTYSKLGFHYSASGGNKQGISNFWQSLSNAGIPIFHKCSDAYGDLYEIDQLTPNPHNVQHNLIYRLSTAGQNNGIQYDVPDYSKTPYNAAVNHWNNTKAILPPEFNKNTVWLELVNEIDKNRSDWIGMFAVEIATLANNAGYKVLLPAWSSGEPEPEHWQRIKPYLEYCASNPNKAAISIHEYDLGIEGFDVAYPYHYGRFQWCFDYCDRNNIARPNIYITEWGWSLNDVPLWDDALDTINKANELYCKYPQIKGCAIWNLGGGWNNIANKVQKYIIPLIQYTLTKTFYEGGLNEPLDPNYFEDNTMTCDCGAISDIRSTIMWIPQYRNLTESQKQQIFDWAENGFPMPDGTMTSGEHPITSSHSEALKIHVNGLPESVLAVVYPSLIGTGVTIEWLEQNCNAVFCDNKQVIFLGENQFQFDHVPIIYR